MIIVKNSKLFCFLKTYVYVEINFTWRTSYKAIHLYVKSLKNRFAA